jgi:APA family basic amino acid/polyamine antiporter
MAGLPAITWKAFFVWSAAGLAIYFFYSYRHSELAVKS